jgi:acylphosphatase
VRRRYLVSGRVQGVGFRRFVQRHAEQLGLAGYVANLDDGRVEVLAEGEEQRLAQFETLLRRGPSLAVVSDLQVQAAPEGHALAGFATR